MSRTLNKGSLTSGLLWQISNAYNKESPRLEVSLSNSESERRIVSGMRPTGKLHLGHLHGVLKNWIQLQHEYDCFFL